MILELHPVSLAVRIAFTAVSGSLASRFRRLRVLFPEIGRRPVFHQVAVERWTSSRPASTEGAYAAALVLLHLGDLAMI